MMKQKVKVSLDNDEAMLMPIKGSGFLFTLYVLLRFIPREYLNVLMSFYLSMGSIFALAAFLKEYKKPSILTGTICVATGIYYFVSKNWILNNILSFSMGVVALESLPLSDFKTSYMLLVVLFLYDIFWVFGTDVMLTVATAVDGPIKMLFPRNVFYDMESKSLLGLGDMIVPGLFVCQTLVFSRDVVHRGNLYFFVAIFSYFLSLVNTMAVMVIFKHGQPALLFIVPWLLITFTATLLVKGDMKAAFNFDVLTTFKTEEDVKKEKEAEERKREKSAKKSEEDQDDEEEESIRDFFKEMILDLFGYGKENTKNVKTDDKKDTQKVADAVANEKKNA
ncbi:minor histocompatibility antigen H13 [Strigomonas culicis]|nr:minor histocompatibility antigen H13 [Strigomonas culicis]|eukprot:EPY29661.1 minor histocompatibility antigen H13 [Strigomonas culicis]